MRGSATTTEQGKARRKRFDPTVAVICLSILFAAYVDGYVLGSGRSGLKGENGEFLEFGSEAVAKLYVPAAWLEAKVLRRIVVVADKNWRDNPDSFEYRAEP